jgi:RNA polymerase sigma-70 factor (ECF subfamily)
MISIVRGLPRFDGRSQFSTWVYRIATNAALDELRRRRRRPVLAVVDDEGLPPDVVDPRAQRTVEASVDRMTIDAALDTLPEDFRVAVVLRDVADLDYGEIAEVLGIPVGTVKSRIARGRSQLAASLGNRDTLAERPTTEPPSPTP